MTTIQSPGHLLSHLARKGDPSAFYTLVAPYAYTTYTALRNAGKDHKETMSQVIPFLKKLYRAFPEEPIGIDFDSWYLGKQKKYLETPGPSQDASDEIFLEHISAADLSHLDSQMKLLFMRNYNRVRADGKRIFSKSRFASLWSNFFLRWGFILLSFLVVCSGIFVYLTFAHIQLTLSVDSITMHRAVTFPSASNKRLFRPSTVQSPPSAVANRPDTIFSSSPSVKTDSAIKAPGTKKRMISQPSLHSASFSAEHQKPAEPVARQRPGEDSTGFKPVQSGDNSGRTIVPPDPKPKSTYEKANSTPLPRKRPVPIVDSSSLTP
jgi:hypothetical protein